MELERQKQTLSAWLRAEKGLFTMWQKRALPVYERALKAQVAQAVAVLRDSISLVVGLSDAVAAISRRPLEKAFFDTWVPAGSWYGVREFRRMSKQKAILADPEITEFLDNQMKEYVALNAGDAIVGITATTKEAVRQVVAEGIREGYSVHKTAKLVVERMDEAAFWRAAMIARTEMNGARNYGAALGADTTGYPHTLTWISTFDQRTRGNKPKDEFNHLVMHGATIQNGEFFDVQGNLIRHPGDKEYGQAGNIINCRCSVRRQRL